VVVPVSTVELDRNFLSVTVLQTFTTESISLSQAISSCKLRANEWSIPYNIMYRPFTGKVEEFSESMERILTAARRFADADVGSVCIRDDHPEN
jgi:hypothetical protein